MSEKMLSGHFAPKKVTGSTIFPLGKRLGYKKLEQLSVAPH